MHSFRRGAAQHVADNGVAVENTYKPWEDGPPKQWIGTIHLLSPDAKSIASSFQAR